MNSDKCILLILVTVICILKITLSQNPPLESSPPENSLSESPPLVPRDSNETYPHGESGEAVVPTREPSNDTTTTEPDNSDDRQRRPTLNIPKHLGIRPYGIPDRRERTQSTMSTRSTPFRLSFLEDCDDIAYYCLRAYTTGMVCGRTMFHVYHDFRSYCMLDYVNCMERYEVWQIAHTGPCIKMEIVNDYRHYAYENDYFLDDYYQFSEEFMFTK